jgi:transposase-like protein
MDNELQRFRAAAARENRGRGRMGRRYSAALHAQAVRYWVQRQRAGEDLADVAATLGVAPWSLQRWTRAPRVQPVQVVPPAAPSVASSLVVVLTAESVRIEGLDVETAAYLVARLR